jgi:hypothetical protein
LTRNGGESLSGQINIEVIIVVQVFRNTMHVEPARDIAGRDNRAGEVDDRRRNDESRNDRGRDTNDDFRFPLHGRSSLCLGLFPANFIGFEMHNIEERQRGSFA